MQSAIPKLANVNGDMLSRKAPTWRMLSYVRVRFVYSVRTLKASPSLLKSMSVHH
jgi:hypothetical protein